MGSRHRAELPALRRGDLVQLGGREQEVFAVLFLDAQHRLLTLESMFSGTLTQTSVYPREVVRRALHHNAAAVIFAHNHPSGILSHNPDHFTINPSGIC